MTSAPDLAPWQRPSARRKPVAQRAAERKARRAALWGQRVADAQAAGPAAVAAVQFDWARATIGRLPEPSRERAWQALIEAIARVREEHAQ